MNVKVEADASAMDTAKLVGVAILLTLGIYGFYFFAEYSALFRVLALLLVAGVAAAIALQTQVGRQLWQFVGDARTEVRKVVWPTRQETLQTTLIVVVMVLLLGIILWLFDMAFMAILRMLTGRGA